MSLLKSALNRTRVENPMVFWGTAAMTMFAVVRMVIGEEGVTAAPSSPAATGPATYVSPYEAAAPVAVGPPAPTTTTLRTPAATEAVPKRPAKLSPVKRPELDQVEIQPSGPGLKPRAELQEMQIEIEPRSGAMRPRDRPELKSSKDTTH